MFLPLNAYQLHSLLQSPRLQCFVSRYCVTLRAHSGSLSAVLTEVLLNGDRLVLVVHDVGNLTAQLLLIGQGPSGVTWNWWTGWVVNMMDRVNGEQGEWWIRWTRWPDTRESWMSHWKVRWWNADGSIGLWAGCCRAECAAVVAGMGNGW